MASTHKSLRSSTASKRPTTSIADGQIALNTNAASPGLFFKDSAGTEIIKVGPVHVGTTAPNATPATGGSTGNSKGEVWLDTSLTPIGVKIWDGSAWQNATPSGSTTVQGLLELATNAETQTGTDTARAVTPAGLQSKVSDSTSTSSSTTIASSTAVKAAYDLADAALPLTGGTVTGNLEIGSTGSLSFEGATADDFETTIAVTDPTADRTITLPDTTGTVVTTGDSGTVTSTMIADGTIVNADVNASAAIAGTKISPNFGAQDLTVDTNVLKVDATNDRVGIGVTSPGSLLHTAANDPEVRIQDLSSASANTADARLGFYHSGGTKIGEIGFTAAGGTTNLKFQSNVATGLTLGTNSTDVLHIDSSGNVGLGTTSPAAALHVSASTAEIRLTDSDGAGAYSQFISGATGNLFIGADPGNTGSNSFTSFLIDNSERMRINSSGNVGIGTTSPNSYLSSAHQLVISDSASTGLTIATPTSSSGTIAFADGTGAGDNARGSIRYGHSDNSLQFSTNATERMRIDSSGNVSIGSAQDTSKFNVLTGTSNSTIMELTGASAGRGLKVSTYANVANDAGVLIEAPYANYGQLAFGTTGTERARIDSSGRLLVGTSSARANLFNSSITAAMQVEGTTDNNSAILVTTNQAAANGPRLDFAKSRGSSVGSNTLVSNGDNTGSIYFQGSDGSEFVPCAAITGNIDGTPGANDMPGRLVFYTTADGASSLTERMRINSSGNITITNSSWVAPSDNSTSLGLSSNRWTAVYAVNGTIQTSDQREKTDITLSSLGSDFIKALRPVSYKWIEGGKRPTGEYDEDNNYIYETVAGQRTHWGFIAQEVKQAVDDAGVDFGGWVLTDKDDPDSQQALRYDQFIAPLTKALQEAIAKIETLEAKVAALEGN